MTKHSVEATQELLKGTQNKMFLMAKSVNPTEHVFHLLENKTERKQLMQIT